LQQRIDALESQLAELQPASVASTSSLPVAAPTKSFDFSRSRKRKIALRFSYEGWHYGGLAIQNAPTPLPTVEEKLVDALVHARLIESRELEAMGFSRCGRTDRGVSAANQVVTLWVRSALPVERLPPNHEPAVDGRGDRGDAEESTTYVERVAPPAPTESVDGELQYDHLLNRLLPPSIRVLAWSPVDPLFDARFSCSGRHYKYFFTSLPHAALDIDAMRDAAALLVGEHDFRNFCKLDGAKQITNYHRRIDSATVSPLDRTPSSYVFDLTGTAFLWHQVRHIVALLFHVGAGLEAPSLISSILDVAALPSKPEYEMASDLPLLLWDCHFPEDSTRWMTSNAGELARRGMAQTAEAHRMRALMADHHLAALDRLIPRPLEGSAMLQKGAGEIVPGGKARYRPLLERQRGLSFDEVNRRWREGRGARRAAAAAMEEGHA
jgi:tRNA pseudouridine38/39 synthase